MRSHPEYKAWRPAGRKVQGRRAVGIAAAGAVLVSGLGFVPPATAATFAPGGATSAATGLLPAALLPGPDGVGPINPNNGYPYWYAARATRRKDWTRSGWSCAWTPRNAR